MIKDRPASLLNQADYKKPPEKPFAVDFDALPALVRKSLAPLGGIQPVTRAMTRAADGLLHDMPSEGEIEFFRKAETRFQPIFVVMNIAHLKTEGETPIAFPYALTLNPSLQERRDRYQNHRLGCQARCTKGHQGGGVLLRGLRSVHR